MMPYKDPEKQKAAQQAWYQANKEKLSKRVSERRKELSDQVNAYKVDKGCCKCRYNKTAVALDVHHPQEGMKGHVSNDCISRWVRRGMAWAKIKEMLDQCEIICSNCHRELHWHKT